VIRAAVFDMDGTLISSEEIWDEVREGLVRETGGRWAPGAHGAMMGLSTPEWTAYMRDALGVPMTREEIAAETVRRLLARYRAEPPFLPGAIDAVRRAAALLPLGLASSSTRELIEGVLGMAGLADLFAVTVSSEEVGRGKPAPEVYLLALRRMGVEGRDAVAIEDTGAGMRSARAAGMRVVAVPNAHYPPSAADLAVADVVLDRIGLLDAEALGVDRAAGAA
jgi:HAD superfamily hydrolase (TIGR01509 family)